MTFWMGMIVGAGIGMLLTTAFYMWLFKVALKNRDDTNETFQSIQKSNGEQLGRIAWAIENFSGTSINRHAMTKTIEPPKEPAQ